MIDNKKVFSLDDALITIYRESPDGYGGITYTKLFDYVYCENISCSQSAEVVMERKYGQAYPNVEVNSQSLTLTLGLLYFDKARSFLQAASYNEKYKIEIYFREIDNPSQWEKYICHSCRNEQWIMNGSTGDVMKEGVVYRPARIE